MTANDTTTAVTTATTTGTTAAAAPARRTPYRPITPQQNALRELSNHWKSLNGFQKSGWQAHSKRVALADGLAPSTRGAVATFVGVNSALLLADAPILSDAPAAPSPPAALPPLLLTAAFSPAPGGLTLTLTAPSAPAYPDRVIVYGAKPRLSGQDIFQSTPFKRLGVLSPLGGPSNLAPMYQAQFYVPGDGYQLTLRLVCVSATGTRSAPLQLSCLVDTPGAQSARPQGDVQSVLKAA